MTRKQLLLLGSIALAVLLAVFRQGVRVWALRSTSEGPISESDRRLAVGGVNHNADWEPVLRLIGDLEMALVPAGCFRMGSTDLELAVAFESCERFFGAGRCPHDFAAAEQPAHEVCHRPFWIGRTEVTNRQYGSSSSTDMVAMYRGPDWPRETVTWKEAEAFCRARQLRLPTESEWEYAARGPDGLIFPWGNAFDPEKVTSGRLSPENVGHHKGITSWAGTYDQSGGVAEWVDAWYATYPSESPTMTAEPAANEQRVVRGGSWFSFAGFMLRSAHREGLDPGYASSVVGFRCAADFE